MTTNIMQRLKERLTRRGQLVKFPSGYEPPPQLIVPKDLHAEIGTMAQELGYTQESLLRCMLELEISLAAKAQGASS